MEIASTPKSATELPLVVDLDGTLLRSDLLLETGLIFLRDHPRHLLDLLRWLSAGKSALKHGLAMSTEVDVTVLPYDPMVIKFIETERSLGRKIVLATASHSHLARRVAEHLHLFDRVIATDLGTNLSAEAKRDALVQLFGEHGFDYMGNSADDLPVWRSAHRALLVNPSLAVERRAHSQGNVATVLRSGKAGLSDFAKALRMHQWLKNFLIFVPIFAAHRATELPLMFDALLAFACFSLCASSVYLLNDLLDLRDDRHHTSKRNRPIASGRISIGAALVSCPVLLVAAFSLALWLLPLAFVGAMATYYALTLAYSVSLKRRMVIDVVTLAVLYTLRIIAGAVAISVALSFWLLAFSMFMFLSLALVKRYAELFQARARGQMEQARGRGYSPSDLEMIASLGAAAGYIAVMVLALYVNDSHTTRLYRHSEVIWLACPLLLTWVSRTWMLAHRGQMNDDPVVFAARDRISLSIGTLLALVFWAAK